MGFSLRRLLALAACALALLAVPGVARAADAPGAPGDVATWTEGDKDGLGTATGTASHAWLTLDDGELTEVYAPGLGTPSIRDLRFVVTDGRSSASASARTRRTGPPSPTRAASPTGRSTRPAPGAGGSRRPM